MIEYKNVWYRYDDSEDYVLKGINLQIERGTIVAVLGDNGSGKTTLIKHANGLLKPNKGDVYVDGYNTREAPISELARKVAIVFQYPEKMFFSPSVEEEIVSTLKNFGYQQDEIKERLEDSLKTFNLIHLRDRSPYSLSGGEQRRLSIAIAYSWGPDYIILDEPTTGLDGFSRHELVKTIYKLVEKGKTVIFVTHDIEFLFEFEPRTILLSDGEIVFDGNFKDLLDKSGSMDLERHGIIVPKIIEMIESLNGFTPSKMTYNNILNEFLKMLRCR